MTVQAILDLLVRNYKKIIVGGLVGLVLAVGWSVFSEVGYEARVFVSLGVGWQEVQDSPTSAWDTTEASEDFAETFMGILKGGDFNERVSEELGFGVGCSVSTFEKGNLMLVCSVGDEQKAEEVAEVVPVKLGEVLVEYNNLTGAQYKLGHVNASVASGGASGVKMGLVGLVLGFLLLGFGVVMVAVWRGRVWHTSQVELFFGGDVAEVDEKFLDRVGDLAFVGGRLPGFEKAVLLPEEMDAFRPEKQSVVLVLGKVTENDLKILLEFISEETKVFTIKCKASKMSE